MRIDSAVGLANAKGLAGDVTGEYVPLPRLNLICANCHKLARPVAHNTGDGWALHLDCECQRLLEVVWFDWPKDFDSLKGSELEAMGFEIV
jgi:hypothetical protein